MISAWPAWPIRVKTFVWNIGTVVMCLGECLSGFEINIASGVYMAVIYMAPVSRWYLSQIFHVFCCREAASGNTRLGTAKTPQPSICIMMAMMATWYTWQPSYRWLPPCDPCTCPYLPAYSNLKSWVLTLPESAKWTTKLWRWVSLSREPHFLSVVCGFRQGL